MYIDLFQGEGWNSWLCGRRVRNLRKTRTKRLTNLHRTPSQVYWRCIVTIQSCSDGSDYGDDTVDIHWIISNFHRYLESWAFTQRTSKNQHLKRLIFIKLPFLYIYIVPMGQKKDIHLFARNKHGELHATAGANWHGMAMRDILFDCLLS